MKGRMADQMEPSSSQLGAREGFGFCKLDCRIGASNDAKEEE